jgi:hypothetical protein
MNKREIDLQQVMQEEMSRGRPRPVNAENLEMVRRMRRVAEILAASSKERYIELIRDDYGLPEESPEFLQWMQVWEQWHGR